MEININELKKVIYDFNSISNRFLRAEYMECNGLLKKFLYFIENNDLIFDYIRDCGEPTYDVKKEVNEVAESNGRVYFILGDTDKEEVANIYHILKYCVQNNVSILRFGRSYTYSTKYNDMVKCFANRVVMVLIMHIEGFLTKIGIDMGMDENIKYSITVNNGQVNLAMNNARIKATQNNGIDMDELKTLIENVKKEAVNISSSDDLESVSESVEVIEHELTQENPRKSLIKTALKCLKAIKGTAEFGAATAALFQFTQTFL